MRTLEQLIEDNPEHAELIVAVVVRIENMFAELRDSVYAETGKVMVIDERLEEVFDAITEEMSRALREREERLNPIVAL
jgi:hypothetical protein